MNELVIFILTHGRSNNVYTLKSLRDHGYTGKVIIVIDNEDETADQYYQNFKDVEIFDKKKIAETFDEYDNFNDRRSIIYARNACFQIAEKLGYKYFMEMDDDYTRFDYRIYNELQQKPSFIYDLDSVLSLLLEFYKNTPFYAIAMAQGGDFIGGKANNYAKNPTLFRKCMNSFICSTDRKFQFVGRINEDVNTYTKKQSIGIAMATIPFVSLTQKTTQHSEGGMSDIYMDSGTYVKSFYSVIGMPSSVYIAEMGDTYMRLHHRVKWDSTVPKILSEEFKKSE